MPPAAAASPDGFPQDFLKGVALSVWQVLPACVRHPALAAGASSSVQSPHVRLFPCAHPPTQNSVDEESQWTRFARRRDFWWAATFVHACSACMPARVLVHACACLCVQNYVRGSVHACVCACA